MSRKKNADGLFYFVCDFCNRKSIPSVSISVAISEADKEGFYTYKNPSNITRCKSCRTDALGGLLSVEEEHSMFYTSPGKVSVPCGTKGCHSRSQLAVNEEAASRKAYQEGWLPLRMDDGTVILQCLACRNRNKEKLLNMMLNEQRKMALQEIEVESPKGIGRKLELD